MRPVPLSRLIVLALVVLSACSTAYPRNDGSSPTRPRVTVDAGILEGGIDTSGVLVFRGIPYAAPPVGDLRWRPTAPPARWDGVRSADRLGHNCMQARPYDDIDPYTAGISEDCLYLNVWTKSLDGRRPVMVWIHGGGFFAGFGGEDRHDGARLAQKGAVVVTINYRLGAFGFLAHPALTAESPVHASGNYGLLDQIAALQWVQRNAARFGGDPSRVTIFGESAGGMSVGDLVASPLARGSFTGAILESGTGSGPFVQRLDTTEAIGMRVAAALGVTGRDANALARLRAVSADTLLATAIRVAGGADRVLHWPTLDGYVLPRSVDAALAGGGGNIVPAIVGSNADESQSVFGAPSRSFARLLTARGARAYLYHFTRAGEDSASRQRGAYHSAEITFVFGRARPLQASAGHASYDATLADAMSDYWVAFATTGDPNGAPTPGKWPRWPVYDPRTDAYLELGATIVAKRDLLRAVYDSLDTIARGRGEVRPQ